MSIRSRVLKLIYNLQWIRINSPIRADSNFYISSNQLVVSLTSFARSRALRRAGKRSPRHWIRIGLNWLMQVKSHWCIGLYSLIRVFKTHQYTLSCFQRRRNPKAEKRFKSGRLPLQPLKNIPPAQGRPLPLQFRDAPKRGCEKGIDQPVEWPLDVLLHATIEFLPVPEGP